MKKLFALLLAFGLMGATIGCDGEESPTKKDPAPAPAGDDKDS